MNEPMPFRSGGVAMPASFDILLHTPDEANVAKPLRIAHIAIGAFVAVFILWSVLAPLESAAIAQGMLRADGGGRKTVQHLEGGIIERFLVKEGQHVKAGQPLVQLDKTQSSARYAALLTNYYTLLALDARLTAERTGAGGVAYPKELADQVDNPEVKSIIAASDAVFNSRRRAMGEQVAILSQRLGQASAEISSVRSQASALNQQERLLAEETAGIRTLVNEGLERKSRLLGLERQISATNGQQGQLSGSLARIHDSMGETRAQMSFLRGQQITEAATQQREVQLSLAEARERLQVGKDILRRQQILAPVNGRVINLRFVTAGGVVGAAQPLLDIVPTGEKIVISARVKANDIDVVHEGQKAEVKLTPYKARTLPMLHGFVREVSADAIMEEATKTLYYDVKIDLDYREIRKVPDMNLISGMPAEVFIGVGSRSLFEYFLQPVADSFHRAFREP